MKMSEIKEMTTSEILERLENEKNLLMRQQLNHKTSPLENPMVIKKTKLNIARLNTEYRQRQIKEIKEKKK